MEEKQLTEKLERVIRLLDLVKKEELSVEHVQLEVNEIIRNVKKESWMEYYE